MDEPIQEVFLEGREVIGNILSLPYGEGVVAVREDNGGKMLFIGEEMATMDVCDGNFVLPPLKFAGGGERKKKLQHWPWAVCVAVPTSGIVW